MMKNILLYDQGMDQELINRRSLLKGVGLLATASLFIPQTANAFLKSSSSSERTLKLQNRHTGEKDHILYWSKGNYCTEGLAAIDHLMRDHRCGNKVPIDLKLIEGMYRIAQFLGTQEHIEIVSGYRTFRTNQEICARTKGAAPESYHLRGQAVDIRLHHTSNLALQKVAKAIKLGGVGYYPRARFVHIDTGPIRYW